MSNERFKDEIKNKNIQELIVIFYSINSDLSKVKVEWSRYSGHLPHADKTKGVAFEEHSLTGDMRLLKRKRAIVLTKLNQLGWNGKGLV